MKCPCSVTNTRCEPWYIISHSLYNLLDVIELQSCNYCYLRSDFPSRFQSSRAIFHYNFVRMHVSLGFGLKQTPKEKFKEDSEGVFHVI